jgi:hypothetical protein
MVTRIAIGFWIVAVFFCFFAEPDIRISSPVVRSLKTLCPSTRLIAGGVMTLVCFFPRKKAATDCRRDWHPFESTNENMSKSISSSTELRQLVISMDHELAVTYQTALPRKANIEHLAAIWRKMMGSRTRTPLTETRANLSITSIPRSSVCPSRKRRTMHKAESIKQIEVDLALKNF